MSEAMRLADKIASNTGVASWYVLLDVVAELRRLHAENENLRAYAMHERSLGAEGPMLELHDMTQERDALKAEVEKLRAAIKGAAS